MNRLVRLVLLALLLATPALAASTAYAACDELDGLSCIRCCDDTQAALIARCVSAPYPGCFLWAITQGEWCRQGCAGYAPERAMLPQPAVYQIAWCRCPTPPTGEPDCICMPSGCYCPGGVEGRC